jgi:hypothetical protein
MRLWMLDSGYWMLLYQSTLNPKFEIIIILDHSFEAKQIITDQNQNSGFWN